MQLVALVFFGFAAVWFAVIVFRTSSMMRSALALLFSMTAIGAVFLTLQAEFLGVLQIMMMATEMAIMAVFMIMYMMDPGGLSQMDMTHQKRTALGIALVGTAGGVLLAVFGGWDVPTVALAAPSEQTHALGLELMERSMLIFETAGVTILVSMIATTALAIRRNDP